MSARSMELDCSPLGPGPSVRLSSGDLRRIEPVQRALLSPLDHESIDDWRRAVNRAVMTAFGSDSAMFQLEVAGVSVQYSEQFDPARLQTYVDDLMPELARERRLFRRTVELKAGNRSILWGDDLEWLYGSEYFDQLVVELRAYDPLWAAVPIPGARFPAVITTYRDRRRGTRFFGADDVGLMSVVQPALEAGVRIVLRTAASRASLTAALEARTEGVLVFDHHGRLLHQTPSVARLTGTDKDERLVLERGRAMARGLASSDPAAALDPSHASQALHGHADIYRLTAVRLGDGMFTLQPAVLVTVARPESALPDRNSLRERFGLTRRQAEVALLLAQRRTDPEIAEMLGISPHTARGHAEAVMGRLGVHDRREIEGLLRPTDGSPGRR